MTHTGRHFIIPYMLFHDIYVLCCFVYVILFCILHNSGLPMFIETTIALI